MKCRNCPLTLPCYAGRLQPLAWCPQCHYLVCVKPDASFHNLQDTLAMQIRLQCDLRTEDIVQWFAVAGGVISDPIVMENLLSITKCSKCDAIDRLAKGMRVALRPEEFDAVELD